MNDTTKPDPILILITAMQHRGALCMVVDCAHRFDLEAAKAAGVDNSALLVAQPDDPSQAFEIAHTIANTGTVGLIVIDGLAATSLEGAAATFAAARRTGTTVILTGVES